MAHLTAGTLQATIGYLYLLSFCPPGRAWELHLASEPLRKGLGMRAGLSPDQFLALARPEACRRIVAFHERTREPRKELVGSLVQMAALAEQGPDGVRTLSEGMAVLAGLPGRAKPENRLRRSRGCQHCAAACRYGFFNLVTRPNYSLLHSLLEQEAAKPVHRQDPLGTLWAFAIAHLWRTLGVELAYISASHLGNLAFCLLALGTSQSRRPVPETEVSLLQQANQKLIRSWPHDGRSRAVAFQA